MAELHANLDIKPRSQVTTRGDYVLDVNGDGWISPFDALLVINHLNAAANSAIVSQQQEYTLDVNADEIVSPLDALLVINYLNNRDAGEGESSDDNLTSADADSEQTDSVSRGTKFYVVDAPPTPPSATQPMAPAMDNSAFTMSLRIHVVQQATLLATVSGWLTAPADKWLSSDPTAISWTPGWRLIHGSPRALPRTAQTSGSWTPIFCLYCAMQKQHRWSSNRPKLLRSPCRSTITAQPVWQRTAAHCGSQMTLRTRCLSTTPMEPGLVARSLDSENRDPSGITNDPSGSDDLWVVDRDDDLVYRYSSAARLKHGGAEATDTFELIATNRHPEGIADPPDLTISDVEHCRPDLRRATAIGLR